MAETMVVIEALLLRKGLRSLLGGSVVKHWVYSVVLSLIEEKEPESCLWALNERNKISGVPVKFYAGVSAEDDVVTGFLCLVDAVESTLGIRDDECTVEVSQRRVAII
jgi:hypothetical protein